MRPRLQWSFTLWWYCGFLGRTLHQQNNMLPGEIALGSQVPVFVMCIVGERITTRQVFAVSLRDQGGDPKIGADVELP